MTDTIAKNPTIGRETKKILRRTYTQLYIEAEKCRVTKSPVRLFKLTGMNLKVVQEITRGELPEFRSEHHEVNRADILKALHLCYLESKYMPTTTQLFSACCSFLEPHMDISCFRRLLFKYDFVWKKIPKYNYVVMERPEVTYERYNYLKTLLECQTDIYFIGEYGNPNDMNASSNTNLRIIYAISRSLAIVNTDYHTEFTKKGFKEWITDELLPSLRRPSVIIFSSADHHCELIPWCSIDLSIESLRCEMTDWLDKNNVPYAPDMCKAELYCLIEQCTDHDANKYVVDNIIRTAGHTPIRLPNDLSEATPCTILHSYHEKKLENVYDTQIHVDMRFDSVLSSLDVRVLAKCFNEIFGIYRIMFDFDIRVEQCMDSLLQRMTNMHCLNENYDSDLPSFSDDSD